MWTRATMTRSCRKPSTLRDGREFNLGQVVLRSPRQVRIIVQDDRSNPFGTPPDAGGCNVCAGGGLGGCGDGPRTVVSFSSNWTHIQVPFAALQPAGWSGPGAAQRALDLSALYSVNFEVEDVPLPPFNLAVAYVELYK